MKRALEKRAALTSRVFFEFENEDKAKLAPSSSTHKHLLQSYPNVGRALVHLVSIVNVSGWVWRGRKGCLRSGHVRQLQIVVHYILGYTFFFL